MKQLKKVIHLLVKNDTGYNSKTQIMVWGVFLISVVIFAMLPLIYFGAFYHLTIPWLEISAFITQLQTLQGVLIWGKVKTDSAFYENLPPNVEENVPQNPKED